ncbi:hypothetical protein J6590_090392 [Homalodisca vitripennis]|nr:hypothetical protein J6590_090392 [Homalodisca vitripennis]
MDPSNHGTSTGNLYNMLEVRQFGWTPTRCWYNLQLQGCDMNITCRDQSGLAVSFSTDRLVDAAAYPNTNKIISLMKLKKLVCLIESKYGKYCYPALL